MNKIAKEIASNIVETIIGVATGTQWYNLGFKAGRKGQEKFGPSAAKPGYNEGYADGTTHRAIDSLGDVGNKKRE
ncbi:MAG: hypothetical protein ABH884_00710 [Candidatus Komeilibacteria bacterium]